MPSRRESTATQSDDSSTRRTAVGRRSVLSGVAGIAVLGTAGCLNVLSDGGTSSSAGTGDWGTYRGDLQRTGRAAADAGPGDSLSIAWETSVVDVLEHREDVTARRPTEDVSRGDRVIAGQIGDVTLTEELALCSAYYRWWRWGADGDGDWGGVVALDAEDGSIEWTIPGITALRQAPTVIDDRLYTFVLYPTHAMDLDDSHVLVADAATGDVEARHTVPENQRTVPTVTADAIYHRAPQEAEATVVAIDPDSGQRDWMVDAPRPQAQLHQFLVTDDSVVYAAEDESNRRMIVALDPDTGDEQWRQPFDVPQHPASIAPTLLGGPSISDGTVYVAGRWTDLQSGRLAGSALRSFDLDGGGEGWTFRPDGVPYEELARIYDTLRCGDIDGCEPPDPLAALQGTPLVVDDLVVVPGYGQSAPNGHSHSRYRHLYAVSADDGSLQWSIPGIATSAVAAGDVIYARMTDDRLIAISLDGTVLDAVETSLGPSYGRAPSIGHGRVYTTWGFGGNNVPGPDTVAAIE